MTYIKSYLSILIIFVCFLTCITAAAQTFSPNTNIDEYSDAQIIHVLQQAQSQGMTDAQVIQQAQSRGMSNVQAQKLQSRIFEIRQKDGNATSGITTDTTRQAGRQYNNKDTRPVNEPKNDDLFENLTPKIFGADFFRNSKANTFEPSLNIPTPVNYMLGPGDKIIINLYGTSVNNWNLLVSPEGNILIPSVGVLKVAGKTIEQASLDIKSKLAVYYPIGRGSSVNIQLGDIRSIRINITGQVVKPGTYTISSLSTVMNALFQAGGPSDIGSFRNIEVIRNNHVYQRMDIYDFLVKNSQKGNIVLHDQDIIRVPTYNIRVELKGEVKIPALFEPVSGETLQDIINFAGGFTDQAYTARIKVDQVSNQQHRLIDVVEDEYKSYTPLRGDKYVVEKILNRYENRVVIKGAVFHPGEFELQKTLTLSQLIKNAGGLKEDAFTGRGSIVRLNPDNTTASIAFNVNDVLNKPGSDIVLQREDQVTISSIFDLRDEYKVTIKGEVRKPADFPYNDSMTVADLIIRAGGLSEGASVKRIEVSRRIFNANPRQRDSKVADVFTVNADDALVLKPFDIVSVYSLPGYETQKTVKVEGEVIYPGEYTILKKNEKISDIIARAGGLTGSADVDGSNLKRDNAAVLGVSKSKIDTAELNKERFDLLTRLKQTYKDSTNTDTSQHRNNFVGINLRKILQKPGSEDDLILENGDVLRVPKQQQTVRVNGEVLFPSAVVYKNGKSFRGYILNAGGYSPISLKSGAYIVYANGTVKGTKKFLLFNIHPRVKPGGEIFVPRKPAKKDNLPAILALTTSFVSMGAIILGILSLHK
ncbi:SLBB domain-containing protein [Mucilaginibacter puniceus]